jgi:ABC-type Na+ efflux pump permease subunit
MRVVTSLAHPTRAADRRNQTMQGSAPAPVFTIARYVLVEARRSALPWLAAASLFAALGLAGFLSQVAITEAGALQASLCAALLRACAVFLVAAHVAASVVREANDKGMEVALALPISRPSWYLGKLLGFACAGVILAALFAAPLLAWAKAADLAVWWLALAAEAAIVAAAALFFASALGQTVAAIAATLGLYLLARSIAAIQAIAGGPLAEGAAAQAARWLVDALALLLPRLDAIARGDWLLYGAPGAAELAPALAGLAIYFVLLAAAGLFDFSRRNL